MRGKFWALAALLTVGPLWGCSEPQKGFGGHVMNKPKRVVSLSPSSTEIVSNMGLSGALMGRSSACNFPPGVKSVPVVVDGTKPDFERIAQIRPEVIVFDGALYGDDVKSKLVQSGVAVFDFASSTLAEFEDKLLEFGSMTGYVTRASEMADKVHNAAETAQSKAPQPRVKSAILMGGSGDYLTAGKGTFVADVLKTCGGEVVGPDEKNFAPYPIEQLVAEDPEVIITGTGDGGKILADPRLKSVKAVKLRQVYEVMSDVLYRAGGRVEIFIESLSNQISQVAEKRSAR